MISTMIYDVKLSTGTTTNLLSINYIELNDNHNPLLSDNDDFRLCP